MMQIPAEILHIFSSKKSLAFIYDWKTNRKFKYPDKLTKNKNKN